MILTNKQYLNIRGTNEHYRDEYLEQMNNIYRDEYLERMNNYRDNRISSRGPWIYRGQPNIPLTAVGSHVFLICTSFFFF
jgi:hypothetical protein